MRWSGADVDRADPALPAGAEALTEHVKAPKELSRRLLQIGLVTREQATALMPQLKPGQRLVSRDGDLWRWDGFSVAANAPTGAARRLAGKNRLADIENELQEVRRDVELKQELVRQAEAEVAASAEADTAARTSWRSLQHDADAARSRYPSMPSERSAATQRGFPRSAKPWRGSRRAGMKPSRRGLRPSRGLHRCRRPTVPKGSSQACALRSRLTAQSLRKRAHNRMRWHARQRSLRAGSRRLRPIVRAGANAMTAARPRSPRCRRAWRRPGTERTALEQMPALFEEKRQGLLSEIESAEAQRRMAADRLAEGENALAEADRGARAALEAMTAAREQAARAEERFEGDKRRLVDVEHEIREMLEAEPAEVAELAGIKPDQVLPEPSEIEATLERLRRERERLGAVNLRAEEELREVENPARHARDGAR